MEQKRVDAMKLKNQVCFPLYAASRDVIKRYKPFLDELDLTYTQYIASLPTVFDETRILQGKLGEYIVTARRLGDAWYVAGQTNWDGERDLTIDFNFLTEGKSYRAHLLTDGINAHHDAEDYRISTMDCNASTMQAVHMMPGGGFVIKLKIEN